MNIKRELLVEKLIDYIKNNFNNGFNNKIIAAKFKINPVYLSHVFRKTTGRTIRRFIEDCRIDKFNELINAEYKHYGYEVGYKLGFKSDYSFYRWVKRVYGKTYNELCAPPPNYFHIQAEEKNQKEQIIFVNTANIV
ncbi:MAG: AraC family transcriptional regulator [Bacteroidota bacterium]|nr:AraC family transcriptional regulator [Bacteroidota bacterium]